MHSLQRHVGQLKDATIRAMAYMLTANIDSGLTHAIGRLWQLSTSIHCYTYNCCIISLLTAHTCLECRMKKKLVSYNKKSETHISLRKL